MTPSLKHIYFSVLTRSTKPSKCLELLKSYIDSVPGFHLAIYYDAESYYQGHTENLKGFPINDSDIVVLCHDDVEILSDPYILRKYLSLCLLPNTGFVGVAGSTRFDRDINGMWWAARNSNETRGFVFQGPSKEVMTPNYFGPCGQVAVLDGCFIATQYGKLNDIGLSKPNSITSNWDMYDIILTLKSHYIGYNNYATPILIRHESPGEMRPEWYVSVKELLTEFYGSKVLPVRLNYANTNRLPVYV